MKKPLTLFIIAACLLGSTIMRAQCPGGYNQATLNWDYQDYFTYSGSYSTGYLPNLAAAQTQNFAFGTQRVTISQNYAATEILGENGTHTGETGAYGTGDDVQLRGNGTITITFENEVRNVKFSLFDVDRRQVATVSGVNNAAVPQTVILTKANILSTTIAVNPLPVTAPSATATNNNVGNTVNDNTINVDIAGPVKTITIAISATTTNGSEDGSFWISDITACSVGNFPTGYYQVSRPFTGQSSYILHAFDNNVYYVNPVTGVTKLLFTDNLGLPSTGTGFINSMAYDPYNRFLYYVYSLTGNATNNKLMRKYDVNTGAITTVLANVNTIGIPTTSRGVESGAAAFYNGSMYIGIEANDAGFANAREAVIWRIDFNGSNIPYRASQVFAVDIDNGAGRLLHDWADFTISNGILYDFDGAGSTSSDQTDLYHYDLMTGNTVQFAQPYTNLGAWVPGQPTVDWNDNVYNLHANTSSSWPATLPYVALYNKVTGTIGTRTNLTSVPMFTPASPSLGDAAEAFRPFLDFGDAPATYDPNPLSPAVNDEDVNLRIGATWDKEWLKRGVTSVEDVDDGLSYLPFMPPGSGAFITQVSVYNNKGVNASLIAWLDYNGNGIFDASEAVTPITVPSSASMQNFYLYWPSTPNSFIIGQSTYLRIRLTTGAMGAANATGYYIDGETEDYRIIIDNYPLSVNLLSFNASLINKDKVELSWKTSGEENFAGFEVQRSKDNSSWDVMGMVAAKGNSQSNINNYMFNDMKPLAGKTFYRLKMISGDGKNKNSETKSITIETLFNQVTVSPNPASYQIIVSVNTSQKLTGDIIITDLAGRRIYFQQQILNKGLNKIEIPVAEKLKNGMYVLQLQANDESFRQKIMINRQ